jgi:hypothetical protein
VAPGKILRMRTHQVGAAMAGRPGWRSRWAMRSFGGRQLAALVPTASHERGEHLGTVDGGEGWPMVVITENGMATEQGTGGGEKLEYGRLKAT